MLDRAGRLLVKNAALDRLHENGAEQPSDADGYEESLYCREGGVRRHRGGDRPADAGDRHVGGEPPPVGRVELDDALPPLERSRDARVAARREESLRHSPRHDDEIAPLVGDPELYVLCDGELVDEALDVLKGVAGYEDSEHAAVGVTHKRRRGDDHWLAGKIGRAS